MRKEFKLQLILLSSYAIKTNRNWSFNFLQVNFIYVASLLRRRENSIEFHSAEQLTGG